MVDAASPDGSRVNVSGVTKVHDHLCWFEPNSGVYLYSPEDEKLKRAI